MHPTLEKTMTRESCAAFFALGCLIVMGCAPATTPATAPAVAPPAAAHADHDHGTKDAKGDHDHDHEHEDHEHPATLAAGLADLEAICAHVRESLGAGDREKADDKVHMVGHLLEDLQELVADSNPAAEAEAAAKKALEEIFDCFDKMDTALHAADEEVAKKLDYAEHAPRIEAAIAKLKELVQ